MKLYGNPLSPNYRRAAVVARHLGIQHETVVTNFATGDLRKPEFLALNPNGRIPVLVDGDFVLTESRAIGQYLATKKPGVLLPSDEKGRADVTRWQFWDAEHFSAPLSEIAFEKLLKPMFGLGEPSQTAINEALERYARSAKVLDAHLAKNEWVAGKTLTIADFSIAASLMYAAQCEVPLTPYRNLEAWLGRMRELDAWRATEPKG